MINRNRKTDYSKESKEDNLDKVDKILAGETPKDLNFFKDSVKKNFSTIRERMSKYKNTFVKIILSYIVCYILWTFFSKLLSRNLDISQMSYFTKSITVIMATILLGLFYTIDGNITSSFKTPFNQLCYSINKSVHLSDEDKEELIKELTTTSEIPKETLKKFGIIKISSGIIDFFKNKSTKEDNSVFAIFKIVMIDHFSYLIPLFVSLYFYYESEKRLNDIEKEIFSIIESKGELDLKDEE